MLRNILFAMSLSGTVVLLFYLLSYPLARRYFSPAWRYHILKVAILFFLVPLPRCKYYVLNVLYRYFPDFAARIHHVPKELETKYLIIYGENGERWFSPGLKRLFAFQTVLVLLAVVFFLIQIFRYGKMKHTCLGNSSSLMDQKWKEYFSTRQKQWKIGRKINVRCSEYCKVPMTLGVLSPAVFLPLQEKEEEDKVYPYMIEHELVHIKYHDFFIRLMGLLVVALHWYNPFAYYLYFELSHMAEIHCDEVVLKGKDEEARKEYSELLIRLAVDETVCEGNRLFVGMINHKRRSVLERRILEMKTDKKFKWGLSAIAMGLACMLGSATVFAYEPPGGLEVTEAYTEGCEYSYVDGAKRPEIQDMPYEYFFVDKTGNIYELDENSLSRVDGCSHTYDIAGTITRHIKNSSGGCMVRSYEALRCSKCGYTKQGELTGTHIYPKCPH